MTPRCPKKAARWPQDDPKMPQDDPKMPQDGPKMAPRGTQEGPKTTPRRPQDASKNDLMFISLNITAKNSPRRSQDPPKRPPNPPGTPPGGGPGGLRDRARGFQNASSGLPRPFDMQSRCRYQCQCRCPCRRLFLHCNASMELGQGRRRPPGCDTQRDFPQALFCLDEYGPIENTPTLRDTCVHLFVAGFIDRCMFMASFIDRRCKRRPRARNTGRRSIAAGVFNPPPRERSERSRAF